MTNNPTTEKVRHTPGPWEFDCENYGVFCEPGYGLVDENRNPLGVTVHSSLKSGSSWRENPSTIANASLIAAAPEMLEALEDAENRLIAIATLLDGCPTKDDIREAYMQAYSGNQRAAIAQATGEDTPTPSERT